MKNTYRHIPKTEQQLRNWFKSKERKNEMEFTNFEKFMNWYSTERKLCHYCGLTEKESQEIVRKGKLCSKRFPKNGLHGAGTSRGMWLEVDRYDPYKKYSIDNVVMCCYFCNNDKSDVFHGDNYKEFLKNRLTFLKSLLTILILLFIASCSYKISF